MNTYIITRDYDGHNDFINASTDKDMIIKQLLLISLESINITVLKENNEQINFMEYMETKENQDTKSLRELDIEGLAKRITKLYDYIEMITQGSAPHVKAKINEIIYGKNNIQ